MKVHIKCPYCNCQTDNLERCEYCGKPISLAAKKKEKEQSNNFNISYNDHQHIKNDPRSTPLTFDHIQESKKENQEGKPAAKKSKGALIFFIIWFVAIILFILLSKNG